MSLTKIQPQVLYKNLFANGYYDFKNLDEFLNYEEHEEDTCDMCFENLDIINSQNTKCKILKADFPEDDNTYAGYIRLFLYNDKKIIGKAYYVSEANWRPNLIEGHHIEKDGILYLFLKWEVRTLSFEYWCLEIPLPSTDDKKNSIATIDNGKQAYNSNNITKLNSEKKEENKNAILPNRNSEINLNADEFKIEFISLPGRPLYYHEIIKGKISISINLCHWFFKNNNESEREFAKKIILSLVATEFDFTSPVIESFFTKLHIIQESLKYNYVECK